MNSDIFFIYLLLLQCSLVFGQWHIFVVLALYSNVLDLIWTMTVRLDCQHSYFIWGCLYPHQINHVGIGDVCGSYISSSHRFPQSTFDIDVNILKLKLKVSTLTSESLFHFKTSVLEHRAETTKNVSLSKYLQSALYFHPLYFIVLICFVLLSYSLQQRLHLPNFVTTLENIWLVLPPLWLPEFDAPQKIYSWKKKIIHFLYSDKYSRLHSNNGFTLFRYVIFPDWSGILDIFGGAGEVVLVVGGSYHGNK